MRAAKRIIIMGTPIGGVPAPALPDVWNPADAAANLTAVSYTLTNTGSGGADRLARSTNSCLTGKRFFQVTTHCVTAGSMAFGLATAGHDLNSWLGGHPQGVGLWDGWCGVNGAAINGAPSQLTQNNTITTWSICVDIDNRLLWVANETRNSGWNPDNVGADPVTGVGGYDFSSVTGGNALFICGDIENSGDAIVLNTGNAAYFNRGIPAGYSAWRAVVASGNVVLDTNGAQTSLGVFRYAENPWGRGALVRGTDFTDTVSLNRSTAPDGAAFNWSWPVPGTGSVMAYPFVEYDGLQAPYPKVSSLVSAISAYNISYTLNGQAVVMFDTWLDTTSAGGTTAFEIQYFVATRGYSATRSQTVRSLAQPYISIGSPRVDAYLIPGSWNKIYLYPATAQTNQYGNPSMSGAAAGTPGTPPTNTGVNLGTSGLSSQIVGSGTATAVDGTTVNYVDVRFFGTATASTNAGFSFNGTAFGFLIPWILNQNAWLSAYMAIVGGSTAHVTNLQLNINGYDASAGYTDTTGGLSLASTLTSSLQHFGLQYIPTPNVVANLNPAVLVWFNSGAAIDITLRIGNVAVSNDVTANVNNETFDWKALFSALTTAGMITGNEYLATIQIGPEVVSGSGSLALNSYAVSVT